MRRLFWKFFAVIWLTLTGSIAVLITVLAFFQVVPFSREVEQGQQALTLDVAARLLEKQGLGAAEAFISEAARASTPVLLAVSSVSSSGNCEQRPAEGTRIVRNGDICYRVALRERRDGPVSRLWPRFVPWLSAFLGAALAAYLLARYLLGPVEHLRSGLSALAAGRFDVRIGDRMDGRKDEVAALAHDFDVSAARLEELQKVQQRLFHDVSHELRSPLSRLRAAIGVLEQNPAKLDAVMGRMVREIERIDGLVGEILTLARLTDQSNNGIEVQTLDVIDILDDIVADAEFEAQSRDISLRHDRAGAFVAEVNGELIYRAIENVVRNAVKYTVDHTQVCVVSRVENDRLRITISDQGQGVPVAELGRIFHPFSRGEAAGNTGGYGLGLAITKQAIEWHGGAVEASTAETGGLMIALELPRVRQGGASA
ncbi:HAMP domain-containing protein [Ensifer sp. ENS06]|uniref:HAMP domain-containing sensor histidine kinase n=1 Tax=Ensifer sp. ENS06 TaxID=2769276 RepID=UPI000DE0D40B|nr:ATP-binding protein [Ensifer sp. ENS06]MBD9626353.1 HAMP domain-containing protein [Ensifer sp. ENS06]